VRPRDRRRHGSRVHGRLGEPTISCSMKAVDRAYGTVTGTRNLILAPRDCQAG